MPQHGMAGKSQLSGHPHGPRLGLDAVKLDSLLGVVAFDTFEPLEEIEMPPGPAELAVGRSLETGLLLPGDDLADLPILHIAEPFGGDFAGLAPGARLLQRCRAQQAPHHIGPEGRHCGHGASFHRQRR